jgi:hypothetical protein
MHIQSKLSIGKNIIYFPSHSKGELDHMEQKEVLEELVGACAIMNKFKVKFNEGKILSFPIRVEEELGHMEGKKVLEKLVGACAIMNKFKEDNLKERSYHFLSQWRKNLATAHMEGKKVLEELVGACAIMNKFKVKLNERKILLFPITVEEELGHMEGKKVL